MEFKFDGAFGLRAQMLWNHVWERSGDLIMNVQSQRCRASSHTVHKNLRKTVWFAYKLWKKWNHVGGCSGDIFMTIPSLLALTWKSMWTDGIELLILRKTACGATDLRANGLTGLYSYQDACAQLRCDISVIQDDSACRTNCAHLSSKMLCIFFTYFSPSP